MGLSMSVHQALTYSTSSPRRALKAPSSMQLMWFLSSCLWSKASVDGWTCLAEPGHQDFNQALHRFLKKEGKEIVQRANAYAEA